MHFNYDYYRSNIFIIVIKYSTYNVKKYLEKKIAFALKNLINSSGKDKINKFCNKKNSIQNKTL